MIFSARGVQGTQQTLLYIWYSRGAAPLARPLAEKYSYPKRVYETALLYVKFQLSRSNSFGDMRGPKCTVGVLRPLHAPWHKKNVTPKISI